MGYIFNFSTRKFDYYVTVPTTPTNTVFFDTEDPNDIATVFDPNTPEAADTLYVSQDVDTAGATWVWNSGTNTYDTEIITVPASTPFYIAGTTIDAGSNKTSPIERRGLILATSFNTKRGLTNTGVSDNNKWRRVFAYVLTTNYVGDSFQLLMNEYNTSNGAGKSIKLDVLIKRQDPSVHVSVNIESGLANFDLTNFAVQYDSTNKRINFYYKTLTTYTYTNWAVLNARASNTSEIVWYNSLLGATLVGQPDDAFTSKTISLNKVNGVYTLPAAKATVAGQVLADPLADGTLSWITPVSGGIIWINNVTTGIPTYYATLELASTAAVSGQTINVGPGTYVVTTTATNGLFKDGVHWMFDPKAVVTKSTAGDMFNDTGATLGGNIYGNGTFTTSGSAGMVFKNVVASLSLGYTFEAISATSTSSSVFQTVGASFTFNVITATSTASQVLRMAQSNIGAVLINVFGRKWNSTADVVIGYTWWYSTRLTVNLDVIQSTAGVAIGHYNSSNKMTINVNEILGSTYGMSTGDGGANIINIVTTNITGIFDNAGGNNYNLVGYCRYLYFGGTSNIFNGGTIANIVMYGPSNYLKTTYGAPSEFGTGSLNISGGVADVEIGKWNYGIVFNSTGGILNILTTLVSTHISNLAGRVINGGVVNITRGFVHGGSPDYGGWSMFDLRSGTLNISSTCKNNFNVTDGYGVLWSGGKLIFNNAVIITSNIEAYAIKATVAGLQLRVNAGGFSTNRTENGGTLAGKKHRWKYTVNAISSIQLNQNDLTGADEIFIETDTITYNTKALLAQRMTALINASGTLDITASQDTPGTDEYFYAEADIAGVNTLSGGNANIRNNLTALLIREGSYPITQIVGGVIIEDADVE